MGEVRDKRFLLVSGVPERTTGAMVFISVPLPEWAGTHGFGGVASTVER